MAAKNSHLSFPCPHLLEKRLDEEASRPHPGTSFQTAVIPPHHRFVVHLWGLGFGVWCLVFGVFGLGFGVRVSGLGVIV
jgi:hypothetical protein